MSNGVWEPGGNRWNWAFGMAAASAADDSMGTNSLPGRARTRRGNTYGSEHGADVGFHERPATTASPSRGSRPSVAACRTTGARREPRPLLRGRVPPMPLDPNHFRSQRAATPLEGGVKPHGKSGRSSENRAQCRTGRASSRDRGMSRRTRCSPRRLRWCRTAQRDRRRRRQRWLLRSSRRSANESRCDRGVREPGTSTVPRDELEFLGGAIDKRRVGATWIVDSVDVADHPARNPDDRGPGLAEYPVRQPHVAVARVVDPTVAHANIVTPGRRDKKRVATDGVRTGCGSAMAESTASAQNTTAR